MWFTAALVKGTDLSSNSGGSNGQCWPAVGHTIRLPWRWAPYWDPAGPARIWAALSIKLFDFRFKEVGMVPSRLLLSVRLSKVYSFVLSHLCFCHFPPPLLNFYPYERNVFSNRHSLLVPPLKPNPLAVLRELERTLSRCSLQSGC